MIRPALEVADILRTLRNRILKRLKSSRSYQLLKYFGPSNVAEPRLLAGTTSVVPAKPDMNEGLPL
jgi:hypothetical protein